MTDQAGEDGLLARMKHVKRRSLFYDLGLIVGVALGVLAAWLLLIWVGGVTHVFGFNGPR